VGDKVKSVVKQAGNIPCSFSAVPKRTVSFCYLRTSEVASSGLLKLGKAAKDEAARAKYRAVAEATITALVTHYLTPTSLADKRAPLSESEPAKSWAQMTLT
jgi:hypothetical protein